MEGTPFLLKHKVEFAASLLLIFHWPDLGHMTILTAREAGKCSLWLETMCPDKTWGEERMVTGGHLAVLP